MPRRNDNPKSDRGAIVDLKQSGMSLRGIGKQLGYAHSTIATSIPDLKKIVRRIWRQVTPEYIHTLYESMSRCMAAVIQAGGAHAKY